MNEKTILIIIGIIFVVGIIGGLLWYLQESKESIPYYFIAIHNEPFNQSGGEQMIERKYFVLKQMIEKADQYNIKLTLMFTAQWADYISESSKRMADLESWKEQGHEIAAHHHSIYHGNWDGYTDYSKKEAEAQRIKQGKIPEEYLGTLDDYINKLKKINPAIKSGCVNDEHDKRAMPDEIIYDTCSGFANYGEPGIRESDALNPGKGKNEYVTIGTYKNIQRKWLTHYQITTGNRQESAQTIFNSMDLGVYGTVTHSTQSQAGPYYDFLESLHLKDPTGEKSRTVDEIIEQKLLPEELISEELINSNFFPLYTVMGKQGKCGDGICDAKEKLNPNLCPQDCEKKCPDLDGTICSSSQTCPGSWLDASDSERCCSGECEVSTTLAYEDSPFGISIAGFLAGDNYEKSLRYMKEAGADEVRFMSRWGGLRWSFVEPQKEVFNWLETDEYYSEATKNNLDIMVNIYPDNPDWDDPDNPYTISVPVDMEAYLNFIKKTAKRYPAINSWILGVELERGDDKKWWTGTPEEYANLFVKTRQTIKSVNPDATVITYGNNIWRTKKMGDTNFTKHVLVEIKKLTNNIPNFSFVYAIHYYKTEAITPYIEILDYTRQMLDEYGFTEIPIVMTDMAPFFWNDEELKEQKVAKHIIKTYTTGFAHELKRIVWAQLSDGYGYVDDKRFEAGLITRDSQQPEGYYKNLGFYTYKLMTEKLEGSNWDNIEIIQESDNVYIYKFTKKDIGNPVWVVWWDYFDDSGGSKTATLNVGNINSVKITEAVPDAESGADLDENDYPNFFNTETKTASNGKITITLGESPVFVEEK